MALPAMHDNRFITLRTKSNLKGFVWSRHSSLFTAIQPTLLYKVGKKWRPLPDERYTPEIKLGGMRKEDK